MTTTTTYAAAYLVAQTQVITYAGTETTTYVYGTEIENTLPDVFSHDLVRAVMYADSTNTSDSDTKTFSNGSGGVYNRVEYTFDGQGEMTSMEDQYPTNGTRPSGMAVAIDGVADYQDAYTYNSQGQLTAIARTAASGSATPWRTKRST